MLNIISSPKVKKIINLLLTSEKSLTEISYSLKVSKPSALKYLNSMETLGLITSKYYITKIGREKKFKIHTYSTTFSIDPVKGVIFFCNQDPLDIKNPLIGQIKQNKFRNYVNLYLQQVLDI